ncbi:GntR family transcriptional regulator [Actinomycetospora endophytica]|uniref:GntR family transcriptional regulator n=1 Tax=Actinomycetospora endophytica TaxID=2291215 RepID=A0ABS8PHX9_9PSEU|nr:GntR family transcriptional regulator [Actinomycetospora endophytica]MCD2197638.1 GntR family transcriptional regulator [Actinomycetospora endophytica]
MADEVTAISRGNHRTPLPEEVATYVRERIISGEVRPGDFLRLEPIAEAMGISNTPVREGLLTLQSEGFVELVPRRGFMAAAFTEQDLRDLFWTQAQLASELAARAAKRITPEQLERLDAVLAEHEAAVDNDDAERMAALGHAFHREINLAADSRRLTFLLAAAVKHLPNRFYASIEGQVEGARQDHPKIVEALHRRDVRKVRSLMNQHILAGADRLVDELSKRGLWSDEESVS